MTTLLSFLFVLGVLVFVHELGHFWVAKRAGILVERFSLGIGPRAFGVTVGQTEYCISWLPFGGYVKLAGMADIGHEEVKGEPWEFQSRPRWVQMSVLAAGPAMNFLLGFLIILGVRLIVGEYVLNTTQIGRIEAASPLREAGLKPGDRVASVGGVRVENWDALIRAFEGARNSTVSLDVIRDGTPLSLQVFLNRSQTLGIDPFVSSTAGSVLSGYPAEGVGLQPGDRIVGIDGEPVTQWWQMKEKISARPAQEIEVRWVRDGVEMQAQIVSRAEQVEDKTVGLIGIGPPMESMVRMPVGFVKAIGRSGQDVVRFTTLIYKFIKDLILGKVSGRALAGPVAIAQMAGQKAQQGWERLLGFMALLSINLAVLNLLPIPVLDGGHLMILTVEAAIRRPLSIRQKEVLQQVGLAFLLFLMLYVTFGDISRIFGWFN